MCLRSCCGRVVSGAVQEDGRSGLLCCVQAHSRFTFTHLPLSQTRSPPSPNPARRPPPALPNPARYPPPTLLPALPSDPPQGPAGFLAPIWGSLGLFAAFWW